MKNRLYEQFARVGRAIASPLRLETLELLAQGERTVESLARSLSIPVANASHHLRTLHAAGLVETRKRGTFVLYRLADPAVFELTRLTRRLAEERLADVDRVARAFFRGRDPLEPVGRADLMARRRRGEVIILDVRPQDEFRAGHIAGARSVPLNELEQRMRELPKNEEYVAYCRGPYCVMAFDAVEILRAHRRRARRLEEGFPEWRAEGLPVESEAR